MNWPKPKTTTTSFQRKPETVEAVQWNGDIKISYADLRRVLHPHGVYFSYASEENSIFMRVPGTSGISLPKGCWVVVRSNPNVRCKVQVYSAAEFESTWEKS